MLRVNRYRVKILLETVFYSNEHSEGVAVWFPIPNMRSTPSLSVVETTRWKLTLRCGVSQNQSGG